MSIFGFARSTALALGVFAFVGIATAQATQLYPAGFAASIYADGQEAVVWAQWLDVCGAGNGFRAR